MGDWSPTKSNAESTSDERSNSSLGLTMFAMYTAVYAAYTIVSAFRPDLMAKTVGGVNLAVWSGFGLIVGAIAMAALYLWLCRTPKSQRTS